MEHIEEEFYFYRAFYEKYHKQFDNFETEYINENKIKHKNNCYKDKTAYRKTYYLNHKEEQQIHNKKYYSNHKEQYKQRYLENKHEIKRNRQLKKQQQQTDELNKRILKYKEELKDQGLIE